MLRRALALVTAIGVLLALASPVHADGDPASDVLLGENVFYPYSPPASGRLQAALNSETAAAHRARFPIKVALIGSPIDLGAIPQLFGKPQQYAAFLDQEISFGGARKPLLVVMPTGYGASGVGRAAASVLGSVPRPATPRTDALAQAATLAVARLAAASGHPLSRTQGPSRAGSAGGSSVLPVVILGVACAGIATGLLAFRRRRARRV
jgi:hypothetical protein